MDSWIDRIRKKESAYVRKRAIQKKKKKDKSIIKIYSSWRANAQFWAWGMDEATALHNIGHFIADLSQSEDHIALGSHQSSTHNTRPLLHGKEQTKAAK